MVGSLALWMALQTAAVAIESVVVLVDVGAGIPPSWKSGIEVHLQEAIEEQPRYRWVPPPKLSIVDAQMVLGCDDWAPPCMGQVATMMAASRAYVVSLAVVEGHASLGLRLVDSKGNSLRPVERVQLDGLRTEDLDDAREWARAYLFDRPLTRVEIEADVPGTEVFLDGRSVGHTPLFLRGEVAPGPHMLSLRAPGRAPLQQPLEVRAGKTTKVEVSLGAGGFAGHEPEIGNNVEPASSLALDSALAPWLLGAGGVTAATAAGLATTWFALLAVSPCQASSLHDQELRLCETQAEAYARGAPQMGNDAGRPEFGRTFKETLLVSVAWGAITSAVLSGALLAAGALAAMSPRGDNPLPTDEEINASSPTKEPVAAAP